MSNFWIYQEGQRVGLLQDFTSIQWLEEYQDAGEVRIVAPPTGENRQLLTVGTQIYNTESNTLARIVQLDLENGEELIVKAIGGTGVLDQRVVMTGVNGIEITGAEAGMYQVVRDNLRGLPIGLASVRGFTETVETTITWGSVLDALKILAGQSGLGFRVQFDPQRETETFSVYRGTNRSERNEDYVGLFSTALGNITSFSIQDSMHGYRNVAIVDGGVRDNRQIVETVSLGNPVGINRRELFVDASSLQVEAGVNIQEALRQQGHEVLREHLRHFTVDCEITEANMSFGKDFYLGDVLPISIVDYGLAINARIIAVRHVYERSGRRLVLSIEEVEG